MAPYLYLVASMEAFMKFFISTVTLSLMITTNIFAAPKMPLKDFDLYTSNNFVFNSKNNVKPPESRATFNFLNFKNHPDIQFSGASVAVLEEIARLRALANQDVYIGQGPDRLGVTVYDTVEPVPGSGNPIYEKRGLRPTDLERLRGLLASLSTGQQKNPLVTRLVEAFRAVSSSAFNTSEHSPAVRPQMASASISSLDKLESISGFIKTKIEFGKGSEKLIIIYADEKPYIVDRGGNLLSSVPVDALERKFSNITFKKFPINNFIDKVRKAGGTASSIAVSALVPILLSNVMVGDANASLTKENTGSTSSSGVVSTQPYINSTRINGAK